MKYIRTKTDEVSIDEHGIVHKKVIEGAHIDYDAMLETEQAIAKISGQEKYLVLVDARVQHNVTPEVFEILKNPQYINRIATAVLTDKLGTRILMDYVVNNKMMDAPMKIFYDQQVAIEWLLQFKKN